MPDAFPGLGSLPYQGVYSPTPDGPARDRDSGRRRRGLGVKLCGVGGGGVCLRESECMSGLALAKRCVGLNA